MAIFGLGAYYDTDVSPEFIRAGLVGTGWREADAPEIHRFVRTLKVGDIVYIKSFPPGSASIFVKGIGIVEDDSVLSGAETEELVQIGRRVRWMSTDTFEIPRPTERNNVRANTIYEEFHPVVQRAIMQRLFAGLTPR